MVSKTLKNPAASCRESSTVRNSVNFLIRSLTPQQATGNALAISVQGFYQLIPSALGEIGILWVQKKAGPLIIHIMLPQKNIPITKTISKNYPDALEQSHEKLKKLCQQIQNFLEGFPVSFSLEFMDMSQCYDFQKKVLLETRQIPRGKVISYGRLAAGILAPGAARAVGSALARNPFPLIIPCHRVIKSTGYLGNFGGGSEMKKFLLQMEGVPSNTRGKIYLL